MSTTMDEKVDYLENARLSIHPLYCAPERLLQLSIAESLQRIAVSLEKLENAQFEVEVKDD